VAAVSRTLVRRRLFARVGAPLPAGPGATLAGSHDEVSRLRRAVGIETLLAIAVLAVTSLLVNAAPARSEVGGPFATTLRGETVWVDVTVDPAEAGRNEFHLYTFEPGGPVGEVEELTAQLSLPSRGVAPIDVPLRRAGPGHFTVAGVDVPIAGDWLLEVVARTSDVDQERLTTEVEIR
jgi:copper transport protein